jgi:hypothetical protein
MNTLPVVATGNNNFLGLVELDHAGTVLYSRPDGDAGRELSAAICGSNYYTDVAPFENVGEFRERLSRFAASDEPAESFIFDCRCHGGEIVPVRVLLARMRQRADGSRVESVLVHIRKV